MKATYSKHFDRPYRWDLTTISANTRLRKPEFGMNDRAKRTTYSMRALRYWYMDQFIRRQETIVGRKLKVCEMGVDLGQMLMFTQGATKDKQTFPACQWDALSLGIDEAMLRSIGYDSVQDLDFEEKHPELKGDYDVVILLHVLEHLHDPDHALELAKRLLAPGGIIIGGFPVVPQFLQPGHENTIRKKARKHGHVSAFSSKRVRKMARDLDLQVDCVSGTFLIRRSGSFLENQAWWIRMNLFFGACLPSYAGELYWAIRKPYVSSGRTEPSKVTASRS